MRILRAPIEQLYTELRDKTQKLKEREEVGNKCLEEKPQLDRRVLRPEKVHESNEQVFRQSPFHPNPKLYLMRTVALILTLRR
jgi:hypothetical protein